MSKLAKLEPVSDLREIWKHEARDFSKWLADEDNLKLLSDAIGIDIVLPEAESAVGSFSVDLFASEEGTARKIIIENQLTDTDHDHLGKIITYAAGKSADVVIWIVKRARDEHRQAIEWLNQRTDENVGFFLVEIELYKIGNSPTALHFNVVERPNDWTKAKKAAEGLSETKRLQLEFWQAFNDHSFAKPEFSSRFSRRRPQPQQWYDLALGTSEYHLNLTVSTQKKRVGVGLYISDNKELFAKLAKQKEQIEEFLGAPLDWIEAEKACRMLARTDGDITKGRSNWNSLFDWYIATAIAFKEMAKKFDV
jgi:hypothetical protein